MRYLVIFIFFTNLLFAQNFDSGHLVLDGDGDKVVIFSNPMLDLIETDFTFEIVFEIVEYNQSYNSTLFTKRTGQDNEGYYAGIAGTAYSMSGHLNYQMAHGLSPQVIGETLIPLNQKFHVAFVYSRQDNIMMIYLNGVLDGITNNFPQNINLNDANLYIGYDYYANAYYFKGKLDEARIWTLARTQEEIQAYMNSELPASIYENPGSGLIAYYKFNETENLGIGDDGLADDIRDYGPYGFHGDLEGDAHIEYNFNGWEVPVTISDASQGETTRSLYFGLEATATAGLDNHLGEVVLPPVPPVGAYDVRFILPDESGSLRDYRNSENTTSSWKMKIQPGQPGYPMTLSWNPDILPEGEFLLTDAVTGGDIINVDMKTVNTLVIENSSINMLDINYTLITGRTFAVNGGWNIVSAPLVNENMSAGVLFSGASSDLFTYNNGYTPVSTLENGKGYWVKYDEPSVIAHYGSSPGGQIAVSEGWNLVGPFAEEISIGNISSTPAGIINSSYYEFNELYTTTTILKPGKGYWVKASQSGFISLGVKIEAPVRLDLQATPEGSGIITIRTEDGLVKRLYLSKKNVDITGYELPPVPPAGVKDIRFDSGTYVENIDGYNKGIVVSGIDGEVEIEVEGISLTLENNGSKLELKDGEVKSVRISKSERLSVSTAGMINTYYLANCYPNPFNPSTNIKYNIAEEEEVSLIVYDILGNKVKTLVDGMESAGEHNVKFDGRELSSGVYIYKLVTRSFNATKKMILMK